MRILVVADVYPPEVSSAANLMQELAQGLQHRGHSVTVVTAYPKHYLAEESKEKHFEEHSDEDGIEVIRVRILPHHKVNFFIRGISQLTMPCFFFSKTKKYVKGAVDGAIIYSPPLPLGLVAGMIKRHYGARTVLSLQDIFPQNAIDLRIMKNPLIIRFFEYIERIVYRAADRITFHSEGGRAFLIEKKHVPAEKIVTVPNWVDVASFGRTERDISFRKEYGLEEKFIFLFAGIIGPAQGVEFIVEVAKRVVDMRDVVFLLVGEGMEKQKVENLIKTYGLTNVVMKPLVAKDDYPALVGDVDVGLVCLSSKNKTPFIPGKFLGYLAAGKPTLAFLNKESDGFAMVRNAQCGYAIEARDADEAAALVRKLYAEKNSLKTMGENGLRYAKEHFSQDACTAMLEKLLK